MDKFNLIDLSSASIESILRLQFNIYDRFDINSEYFTQILTDENLINNNIQLVQSCIDMLDISLYEKYNKLELLDLSSDMNIYTSIKNDVINIECIYNNIFNLIVESGSMVSIKQEYENFIRYKMRHDSLISLKRADFHSNIVIDRNNLQPVKLYKLISVSGKLLFFNNKFLSIKI